MARSADSVPLAQPGLMREAAELLCGGHNPALALSDALRVNLRSVQRWMAGQNRLPPALWQELLELIFAKEAALIHLRRRIEELEQD